MKNNFNTKTIKSYTELQSLFNQKDFDSDLIKKAYNYAKNAHSNQVRISGEPVIEHCLTVAKYCVLIGLDTNSICAALMHDSIEKGKGSLDEIDKMFGTEIAFIVDGVTKIRDIAQKYKDSEDNTEDFKKLILNSSEDVRIILIRLAEKLHNTLSLESLDENLKLKAAHKIINIYAPLSEYLGLGLFRNLLEDNAFKHIKPDFYNKLENEFKNLRKKSENEIKKFQSKTLHLLNKYKFKKFVFEGRQKGLYSAYKKIKRKSFGNKENLISLSYDLNLKDIFAFRIIFETIEQCYICLGLLHNEFTYLQEDFEDYISKPKPNGYKSRHTVLDFDGTYVEVQIRTFQMHEYNEYGPASHIAYKIKSEGKNLNEPVTWTKELASWQNKKNKSNEDFKVNIFKESIFTFTPKGLVINLPKDSSPIDFAFQIHTDLGYKYAGAKVNGKMVSMNYKLKTGDVVEIITAKKFNVSSSWLKAVKSSEAKSRIRRWMRKEE